MEKQPYTKPELEKQLNLREVVEGTAVPVSGAAT
jgi:hypothetical protein